MGDNNDFDSIVEIGLFAQYLRNVRQENAPYKSVIKIHSSSCLYSRVGRIVSIAVPFRGAFILLIVTLIGQVPQLTQ
jgi:hypothetical protein